MHLLNRKPYCNRNHQRTRTNNNNNNSTMAQSIAAAIFVCVVLCGAGSVVGSSPWGKSVKIRRTAPSMRTSLAEAALAHVKAGGSTVKLAGGVLTAGAYFVHERLFLLWPPM